MRIIITLLGLSLALSSCHVGRFFVWNFADHRDYKKFHAQNIQKSAAPFRFIEAQNTNSLRLPTEINNKGKKITFEELLDKEGTLAFMVIRNDSVLYEKYFSGYNQENIIPSFSVAKSFTSALVGIAVAEGHIKSVQEPITNYLTDLDKAKFGNITIEHALDMRTGIKYKEQYFNPFGDIAKYYYGRNLKKYIRKQGIRTEPDKDFEYISLNTQLLGLIVEKAVGKPLGAYLQEKLWQPLGMEYDATWSIDSKKHNTVKAFCCLNARARDFAKFGRLYLRKGDWEGKQLLPADWVRKSTTFDKPKNGYVYTYQWWHLQDNNQPLEDYFAEGILGQYIYVYPSKNMIIVRLGKRYGKIDWQRLFHELAIKQPSR